jgi:hypothetical protein
MKNADRFLEKDVRLRLISCPAMLSLNRIKLPFWQGPVQACGEFWDFLRGTMSQRGERVGDIS